MREDTKRKLVQKDGSAKCEYVCDTKNGYTFDNGRCVKPTKPQTKKIRCGGELPENVEDTSTHYEDVECMYNSTTKKYDCPEVKWKYKNKLKRTGEREIDFVGCQCEGDSRDTSGQEPIECLKKERDYCKDYCLHTTGHPGRIAICKKGEYKMVERTPRICEFQCSP